MQANFIGWERICIKQAASKIRYINWCSCSWSWICSIISWLHLKNEYFIKRGQWDWILDSIIEGLWAHWGYKCQSTHFRQQRIDQHVSLHHQNLQISSFFITLHSSLLTLHFSSFSPCFKLLSCDFCLLS